MYDFYDFVNGRYDIKKRSDIDLDEKSIEFWEGRPFYQQMLDLWAEVNSLKGLDSTDKIKDQLHNIKQYMTIIRESPENGFNEEVKKTFRIAEWELYDYYIGDNEFCNDADSVSSWYDQWCYDINYDLLT